MNSSISEFPDNSNKAVSVFNQRQLLKTREEVFNWLYDNFIELPLCEITENLTVNAYTSVDLAKRKLEYLPINFGYVKGNFDIRDNNLSTLEGSPKEVGGNFYCGRNNLTSLRYSPRVVGDSFLCYFNQLTDLVGGPEQVKGTYNCHNNQLYSLKGLPTKLDLLNCDKNNLETLEFISSYIHTSLVVGRNPLKTLRFAPDYVGKEFWAEECLDLDKKEILTLRTKLSEDAKLFFAARYKDIFPNHILHTDLSIELGKKDFYSVREKYLLENQIKFDPINAQPTKLYKI